MILLTLSRGKGEETVRLQLPASPAEIEETFAFLDRISLDTTATAILDVSSNVPVLYRCLYDVDVEDSEQFQKLQKLAERTEALSPAKAAIFSGALDAECVWNLEGALTVADRLDEYMLVNNVSSDSELGIYLVNKGIIPFPDRFKPYINYARVGAEYREKHGGEYSSGNYVQKKTPELLENERLDGVFRIWMENPCPVRVQSETAQITLPATFEQLESARQLLGVDSLNMAKLTRVEALRPYGYKKCSLKHKVAPQEKFCRHYQPCIDAWEKGEKVVKFIGYDAGEERRLLNALPHDLQDKKYQKEYPLMEWGWSRKDCIQAIRDAGLPLPGKSSCFFCPSMKRWEIRTLYHRYPDLLRRALAIEDAAMPNLTSVRGLGRNWAWRDFICADENQLAIPGAFSDEDLPCSCCMKGELPTADL